MVSRREMIQSTGATLSIVALSGCVDRLIHGPVESGDIIILNEYTEKVTVTLTLVKFSEDDDAARYGENTPPEATAILERQKTLSVGAGNRKVLRNYIPGPGAYFIEAELDSGEKASITEGFYQAAEEGEVVENYIHVEIQPNGRLSMGAGHSD